MERDTFIIGAWKHINNETQIILVSKLSLLNPFHMTS